MLRILLPGGAGNDLEDEEEDMMIVVKLSTLTLFNALRLAFLGSLAVTWPRFLRIR